MHTEKSQPSSKRIMPRFRQYPVTLGLEFLGLRRRMMKNYIELYHPDVYVILSPDEVRLLSCICSHYITCRINKIYIQSTLEVSKSQFIPIYLYIKVNFQVPENSPRNIKGARSLVPKPSLMSNSYESIRHL